ncbi:GNAT family N-acetyltransferase [Streptomyces sp. GS7]|uniref:GNAT family N-acetyltransferase n=1 Tax=Streptomyces sp. GS7 TaxID=2692234 RepID=UPI0013160A97|nr:GNAT family N-acetyltransferase [Streptomyces sp. GS7]QHC23109.1 GNAT family N-acetyltransferase [Streptomyces sp. GS7]
MVRELVGGTGVLPEHTPSLEGWFAGGPPGALALAEHVRTSGIGQWWTDRATGPRALAVACADHLVLRGDPQALEPAVLDGLAARYVQAPARFLPVLGRAFELVVPWERMVYVHRVPVAAQRTPRGVTVRRLVPGDAPGLAALDPDTAWIHASWGGPAGLAASGAGWAAFRKGHLGQPERLLAVACTYFQGTAHEDIACVTVPDARRQRLALACVTALCRDIAARGRTPTWTCSRDNRPSRLLAWTAGFRLAQEYVHYVTGRAGRT